MNAEHWVGWGVGGGDCCLNLFIFYFNYTQFNDRGRKCLIFIGTKNVGVFFNTLISKNWLKTIVEQVNNGLPHVAYKPGSSF